MTAILYSIVVLAAFCAGYALGIERCAIVLGQVVKDLIHADADRTDKTIAALTRTTVTVGSGASRIVHKPTITSTGRGQ